VRDEFRGIFLFLGRIFLGAHEKTTRVYVLAGECGETTNRRNKKVNGLEKNNVNKGEEPLIVGWSTPFTIINSFHVFVFVKKERTLVPSFIYVYKRFVFVIRITTLTILTVYVRNVLFRKNITT